MTATTLKASLGPEPQRRRRRPSMKRPSLIVAMGLVATALIVGVGLLYPLAKVIGLTFSTEGLTVLGRMFTNPVNRQTITNTVVLGVLVAVIGTAIAFLLAYVQARLDVPGKKILHLLAILPVVSPPFALASSVIVLFGRNGLITNKLFGLEVDIYGLDGLTLVLALSFFPVIYMSLLGMMQRLDPSLDQAATNLGASKAKVFFTVTLPLMLPGIASGVLLLFVEAIADLANPLVLGGDFTVLSSRAYLAITGEYDVTAGSVYSISLLVPALLVFLLQRFWVERKSTVTVTGKPSGSPLLQRGPVAWVAYGATVFIALLILVIYATIIYGGFAKVPGVNWAPTLANYKFVLTGIGSEAIIDTTVMSIIAAPIASLLGIMIAWLTVTKLKKTAGFVDFVAMLGIAVPGTVLGIGVLLAFRPKNLVGGVTVLPSLAGGAAVAGGAIAIILVFVLRSLPAAVRSGTGSLKQIHGSIEEASASLGASEGTTFRLVTLPLVAPALVAGLTFAIARCMTTLSPIVFLTTPRTKVMTSQILAEVDAGRFGNAFAYCTLLMIIVLTFIGGVNLMNKKMTGKPAPSGTAMAAKELT